MSNSTLRYLAGTAGGASLQTGLYKGRSHLIVPVVALMEGVIHAVNAPTAEFVPLSELSNAPQGWNGRPVMPGHPAEGSVKVSANSPTVLAASKFGTVFNTRMSNGRLLMDAWLDIERAKAIGGDAQKVIQRLNNGQQVEVSVGAFVTAEPKEGEYKGKRYAAQWKGIIPDHLAMLPEATKGACSIEMGCGAPRSAEEQAANKETDVKNDKAPRAAALSYAELRERLNDAIAAVTPGFICVESVSTDDTCIYSVGEPTRPYYDGGPNVSPMEPPTLYRRSFTLVNDEVELEDDAVEVEPVTTYEPVERDAEGALVTLDKDEHGYGSYPKGEGGDKSTSGGAAVKPHGSVKGDEPQGMMPNWRNRPDAVRGMAKAKKAGIEEGTIIHQKGFDTPFMVTAITPSGSSDPTVHIRPVDGKDFSQGLVHLSTVLRNRTDKTEKRSRKAEDGESRYCRFIPQAERDEVDSSDFAGPHQSYPIVKPGDVKSAAALVGKAADPDAVKSRIISIAKRKGPEFVAQLPESWKPDNRNAACGCTSCVATDNVAEGESTMTAEQRAAAIKSLTECPCSGFTSDDVKMLEAAPCARLEQFVAAAEKRTADLKAAEAKDVELAALKAAQAKTPTEEEYLANAPESIRTLVADKKAQDEARKTALVTSLKTAQSVYDEEKLKGMTIAQLEDVSRLVKVDLPVDYSGRGIAVPRVASSTPTSDYAPPDPYAAGLKALQTH